MRPRRQFLYGEDALDVTKLKYMTKFDFSARNYRALVAKYRPDRAQNFVDQTKGACHGRAPGGTVPLIALQPDDTGSARSPFFFFWAAWAARGLQRTSTSARRARLAARMTRSFHGCRRRSTWEPSLRPLRRRWNRCAGRMTCTLARVRGSCLTAALGGYADESDGALWAVHYRERGRQGPAVAGASRGAAQRGGHRAQRGGDYDDHGSLA